MVSLLKAWYGEAATRENDCGYDWLPKIVGDHSHMPMFVAMAEGKIKGFMAMGQNPAVGGQNAGYQRKALAKLEWMVVKDLYETETATFWKDSPEVHSGELKPEEIATEVFLLPAAATAEMDGTYTNTQRLIQWHDRACDPPGDARSDLWFTVHLGLRLKKLYADEHARTRPADPGPDLGLHRPRGERRLADQGRALGHAGSSRRSTGPSSPTGKPVTGFGDLKADGSTACGAWIYSGVYAPTPERARRPQLRRQPAGGRLGRAGLGLRLAGQPPDPLQPGLRRPRGQSLAQGGPARQGPRQGARRDTSTGTRVATAPTRASPTR